MPEARITIKPEIEKLKRRVEKLEERKSAHKLLDIGSKKAVLVGIDEYVDSSINNLQFSVNDVKSFCEILIDSDRGQYDSENVKLLIGESQEGEKPNRSNIMSSITALSRTASAEDSILFYFSGHGIEERKKSYLLPLDSRINVLKDTAIPIEWIKKILMDSNARAKIIILDACHAGAIIGKAESGRMTQSFHETIFPAPEGFVVLSSCKTNEVSHEWPAKEHGVFSYFLVEGLQGVADKDRNGAITITDASNYVTEKVRNWAFKNSKEQNPTLECKVSGDILLVMVPKEQAIPETTLIDKSIIQSIRITQQTIGTVSVKHQSLTSALDEATESYLPKAESICGQLLDFFEADEIVWEDSKIRFPAGLIQRGYRQTNSEVEYWLEVVFNYKRQNWALVDSVIARLDGLYSPSWVGLSYYFGSKMNLKLLVKQCKQRNFDIKSFMPSPEGKLGVITQGWGSSGSRITFQNTERGSWLRIAPLHDYRLDREFYETIKPENILDFLKGCFH